MRLSKTRNSRCTTSYCYKLNHIAVRFVVFLCYFLDNLIFIFGV